MSFSSLPGPGFVVLPTRYPVGDFKGWVGSGRWLKVLQEGIAGPSLPLVMALAAAPELSTRWDSEACSQHTAGCTRSQFLPCPRPLCSLSSINPLH